MRSLARPRFVAVGLLTLAAGLAAVIAEAGTLVHGIGVVCIVASLVLLAAIIPGLTTGRADR